MPDPLPLHVVRRRVAEIAEAAESGDFGRAHALEDLMRDEVLEAIGRNTSNAPALARAALRSRAIDFPRRCAP